MIPLRHVVMAASVLPHHSIGGMQTVAWDLARALVAGGLEVTVLTAEIPGRDSEFIDAGVAIRALPKTRWRHYGPSWWRATRNAFESGTIERCDLLLSVSAAGFGLLPLRERIPRVPFVMQAHGTSMGEFVSKWRARSLKSMLTSPRNLAWVAKDMAAYPRFDAIVAVGDRVAQALATSPTRWAVDPAKVHVIKNGIDTATFRPDPDAGRRVRADLGWDPDLRVVVSASRLHRQKGLSHGLRAFAQLAAGRTDLRYLIVGDGPELAALRREAASLRIDRYVHFAGPVGRVAMAAYLNAADVMLFTTTHVEGEPLNVLESLAVGLPAVVSRHLYPGTSPSDHIRRATPTDPAEVAAALRSALALRAPRLSRLPPGYAASSTVAQYVALFERLVRERAAAERG